MDHHQQAGSYNWPMWTPTAAKQKLEYDSWEERAFAEDAAGLLGSGCVWPPRSYTCTFCRREFRSAQALGGHMNVHRRDRARLKQLPNTPQDEESLIAPFYNESGGTGIGFVHPPTCLKVVPKYKKCPFTTFPYNSPYPNNLYYSPYTLSSTNSCVGQNRDMQGCNFSSTSNYHQQIHDGLPTQQSREQDCHRNYGKRDAKIIEVECRDHESHEGGTKCAKSELSISLSLVVRRSRPEEEASCFKRRKIVSASPEPSAPLIFASEAGGGDHMSKIEIAPREIDLELRLGG